MIALVAAVAVDEGAPVRIGYACERNHATVDWSPERARSTHLRLARDWMPGRFSRWTVTAPAAMAGRATTLPATTGSIGGSEGIRWTTADGHRFDASISFSDIVRERGPDTLWLDIRTPAGRSDKLTCGPVSRTKLSKEHP